jgi:hypothetical protein
MTNQALSDGYGLSMPEKLVRILDLASESHHQRQTLPVTWD